MSKTAGQGLCKTAGPYILIFAGIEMEQKLDFLISAIFFHASILMACSVRVSRAIDIDIAFISNLTLKP